MDNMQAQLNADVNNSSVYPQDPYDRDIDWARADFDVRHVFSVELRVGSARAAGQRAPGGWQFNGIVTLRSGVPFTPALGATNWSRSGSTSGEDRPNLRPGVDPERSDPWRPGPVLRSRPASCCRHRARSATPAGTVSTGPSFAMTNVSLVKNTRLGMLGSDGAAAVPARGVQPAEPSELRGARSVVFAAAAANEAPLATAGRITRTITSARQLQLGVKFLF